MTRERCDTVLWDVSGTLLADVRSKLRNRTREEGPKLLVEAGEWLDQKIVVGASKRLIRAHTPSLAEALSAMIAAHRPSQLLVVGPAAAVARDLPLGHAVLNAEEPPESAPVNQRGDDQRVVDPSRVDPTTVDSCKVGQQIIAQGVVDREATDAAVTTDWADAVRAAAHDLGVAISWLAIVTEVSESSRVVPPASPRRTLSRTAGKLIGNLLAGRIAPASEPAIARTSATKAVEAFVGRNPTTVQNPS